MPQRKEFQRKVITDDGPGKETAALSDQLWTEKMGKTQNLIRHNTINRQKPPTINMGILKSVNTMTMHLRKMQPSEIKTI
jgi:hypothetical protein